MPYEELTPENLTPNQAKYFQPSKALPYKDYIIDKSLQGMTPSEIHRKLLKEFPKSQDVTLASLKRVVKKSKSKPKTKINDGQCEAKLNKSKEIRKLVKEMIHNKTRKTNPKIGPVARAIKGRRRHISERLAAIHDLVVEEIRDMQAILQDGSTTN